MLFFKKKKRKEKVLTVDAVIVQKNAIAFVLGFMMQTPTEAVMVNNNGPKPIFATAAQEQMAQKRH